MATPEQRVAAALIAVHTSWARTANRRERTEAARAKSPTSLIYWVNRIRGEGIVCGAEIELAAGNAHQAYMRGMSLKAAKKRAAKKAERAQQLQRASA